MLESSEVRKAASPFVRVRIRVPEAYLLLGPLEAKRPGLVVLDADGRRVDAHDLAPVSSGLETAADVAAFLAAAAKTPAVETWRIRLGGAVKARLEAIRDRAAKAPGVRAAAPTDRDLVLRTEAGILTPEAALALAGTEPGGDVATLLDPVPVRLSHAGEPLPPAARDALARVPGVLHVRTAGDTTAYVDRRLLDPAALERAAGRAVADAATIRLRFEALPQGGGAVSILRAGLAAPGVISLFPDVPGNSVDVVVRRGEADAASLRKAFRDAGANPVDPDAPPEAAK